MKFHGWSGYRAAAGGLVLVQASRNTKLPDSDWELWLVRLVRECQILGVLDSLGRVSSRMEKLSNCHLAVVELRPCGGLPRCVRQGRFLVRASRPAGESVWMYA